MRRPLQSFLQIKLPDEFQLGFITQVAAEVIAIAVQEFAIHGGATSAWIALGIPRYDCQDVRVTRRQCANEIIGFGLVSSDFWR